MANAVKDEKKRAVLKQRAMRAIADIQLRAQMEQLAGRQRTRGKAAPPAGVPSMLGGVPRKKKKKSAAKKTKATAKKPAPRKQSPKRGAAKPRPKSRAAPPTEQLEADQPAVVNLGFSDPTQPDYPLVKDRALAPGETYYFWLEVGSEVRGSISETPTALPLEHLPREATLGVMLFGNEGGFELKAVAGWLRLHADGTVDVATPADVPEDLFNEHVARQRLFFEVRAPRTPGIHRLRCCICFKGALVQSYDIEALVDEDTSTRRPEAVLRSRMDYTLSSTLGRQTLDSYGEHRLTIMLNDNGKGTHGFRVMGEGGEYYRNRTFDGQEVQDIVERARRALRRVSWGSDQPWKQGDGYLYEQDAQRSQLTSDLVRLAIAGYRNYDVIASRLDEGTGTLRDLMRTPATVQLALKETARLVLPLALLYDHTLDTDGDPSEYTLCDTFTRATGNLEEHPCFLGDCPHRDTQGSRVVCPSGFWGYRHQLGIPPTLGSTTESPAELPGVLECAGEPNVLISVSTDPAMRERDDHVRALTELLKKDNVTYAETRKAIIGHLRSARAHVVYFYGHGGVDDGVPYMQVGAPNERISRATLRAEKVVWSNPRALVFLNGCHTTNLEPERAIELVSGFVQTARGSGVIGTEITIFEPLATFFAEVFMTELAKRTTVGESIRRARLRLLEKWNPLGLVYVPYALASLRLS
ncbi:MAG: CHAT domain-containing protein [Labilithrix sp.]|nr:CHAT domain-containing protein [Labilithrix sp.]